MERIREWPRKKREGEGAERGGRGTGLARMEELGNRARNEGEEGGGRGGEGRGHTGGTTKEGVKERSTEEEGVGGPGRGGVRKVCRRVAARSHLAMVLHTSHSTPQYWLQGSESQEILQQLT